MSRPQTHGLLHLLRPVVLPSPYRVLLTFMLGATLAAATYRERPNPRDESIHFNRLLFALHNIFRMLGSRRPKRAHACSARSCQRRRCSWCNKPGAPRWHVRNRALARVVRIARFIGDHVTLCSDCKTFSQPCEIPQPTYQPNRTNLCQFLLIH